MAFYKTELQDQGRTFPRNSKRTGLGSVRRLRVRVFLWPCFCVLFVCVFQKLVFFLKSDVPFFLVQGKFLFRAGSLDVTTWNLGGFERSHVWVSSFFMWFWIDFTTTSTCLRHVRLHGWQTQRTTWLGPLVSRLRNHATKTCRSRVGMFWISRSIFWSLLHVNINVNLQLPVDEQILKQNRLKKRSKTGFHMMRMILHHIVYSRWWFLTELKIVLQLNLKSCSNRGVQKKNGRNIPVRYSCYCDVQLVCCRFFQWKTTLGKSEAFWSAGKNCLGFYISVPPSNITVLENVGYLDTKDVREMNINKEIIINK